MDDLLYQVDLLDPQIEDFTLAQPYESVNSRIVRSHSPRLAHALANFTNCSFFKNPLRVLFSFSMGM